MSVLNRRNHLAAFSDFDFQKAVFHERVFDCETIGEVVRLRATVDQSSF